MSLFWLVDGFRTLDLLGGLVGLVGWWLGGVCLAWCFGGLVVRWVGGLVVCWFGYLVAWWFGGMLV